MGRGKKKDKKDGKEEKPKPEELSVSTLSLGDPVPSTSSATTVSQAKPEPEEKPAEATVAVKQEAVEQQEEDDEVGLGLAKKKRTRKKKTVKTESTQPPGEPVRAQVQPSPAPSGDAPAQPPAAAAPAAAPAPAPAAAAATATAAAPAVATAAAPAATGRGQGPTPQLQPPAAPTSAPAWGRGAGRGVPPQVVPQARQITPGLQPSQPQPTTPVRQQQQPTQTRPSVPATSQQPSTQLVNYKVPAKIPEPSRLVRSKAIKVLANYLEMTIQPFKIYRYDVGFKPDKPKKLIPIVYHELKRKYFPQHLIAFDQMKNAFALKPLPNVTETQHLITNVEITDNNGKTMKFEVTMQGTGIVDLNTILAYMKSGTSLNPPTEAIQCVDIILRQGTLESYVKAGRQFFKRPNNPIDLGDGLEMWTGLFQSAIFTSRPFINVDVAHKGFPRHQPMIQAMQNDFKFDLRKPLNTQYRSFDKFKQFIKGLRVIAKLGGDKTVKGHTREFICNDLVDPPGKLSFTVTDAAGRQSKMTVLDYFVKEKKCRLQYPDLNCMWVGPRDKGIYYPLELLDVAYGQALNKQLNEQQLSTMVRTAAAPPADRKRKIEDIIVSMDYSRNQFFKHFGLNISNDFLEVDAKVLMPPTICAGSNETVMPRRGVWQQRRMYTPMPLQAWTLVAIETDGNACNYENFKRMIMDKGREMGMPVSEPMITPQFNVSINSLGKLFPIALSKGVKLLFVIVSSRGHDYYHRVKKMAEREVGILTQCIKEFTAARKMNHATAGNILLKVNSKLMGINQVLDPRSMPQCLKTSPTMVVGADVTHPSPDQISIPSIAAVTASMDPECFQYNICLSIQTPKKEMIVEFEDMMLEHLRLFKQRRNTLPKKIFVFRDGVSEGQFQQVMNSELTAVHNAYRTMAGPNVKPEILFLLVQKRHHTRFFSGRDNVQNVEPGTVVDKHIVHARELDFYLVSHQAIKGTARPTRYHAVCNDGRIPDEEVEQLAYYLCHLYSRCTRAVSYPTPTYYAHLACLRARSLTHGDKFDNEELARKPKRLRVLEKILDTSRMFFV